MAKRAMKKLQCKGRNQKREIKKMTKKEIEKIEKRMKEALKEADRLAIKETKGKYNYKSLSESVVKYRNDITGRWKSLNNLVSLWEKVEFRRKEFLKEGK